MRWAWIVLLGPLALVGCVEPQAALPLPELDVPFYQQHVHPIARWSCTALECHGVEGRPLRLYSEDGLRASGDLRGQPLSDFEASENALSFEGVDPVPRSVDEHTALTKPLSVDAGGLFHEGDDLWLDRADPSYVCLRGWLAGELDVVAACEQAERAIEPPP
ncbi:MAG: hypothetical protein H6719_33995 [Sandaracinaceae bacterium]|nr:hypothetical protein [Sandaracinaceae bacterium]